MRCRPLQNLRHHSVFLTVVPHNPPGWPCDGGSHVHLDRRRSRNLHVLRNFGKLHHLRRLVVILDPRVDAHDHAHVSFAVEIILKQVRHLGLAVRNLLVATVIWFLRRIFKQVRIVVKLLLMFPASLNRWPVFLVRYVRPLPARPTSDS